MYLPICELYIVKLIVLNICHVEEVWFRIIERNADDLISFFLKFSLLLIFYEFQKILWQLKILLLWTVLVIFLFILKIV